jgi:hypothetical protein
MTLQKIYQKFARFEKAFDTQEYQEYLKVMNALGEKVDEEEAFNKCNLRGKLTLICVDNGHTLLECVVGQDSKSVEVKVEKKETSIGEELLDYVVRMRTEKNLSLPPEDEMESLKLTYDKLAGLIMNEVIKRERVSKNEIESLRSLKDQLKEINENHKEIKKEVEDEKPIDSDTANGNYL